jgi:short-chain fatty acids transporter
MMLSGFKDHRGGRMLVRIAARSEEFFRRWLPDPFVFAVLLTIVTAVTSILWVKASPAEILSGWYEGFWMLLEFGMQMVLILASGYAIALSQPVARLIDRFAQKIQRPSTVYITVLVVGSALVLVSWGWVVLTAVLGRELARRVDGVHYPYLVACAFFSSGPWVAGLSSSIPLLLNTPGNFLIETGLLQTTIPISQTLGSPFNLMVMAVYLVLAPTVMWLLRPRGEAVELQTLRSEDGGGTESTVADEADALRAPVPVPSDRLNNSPLLLLVVVVMGLSYIVLHFVRNGFDLNLNIMIFIFVILGMLLHRRPIRYVVAMARSCSNISGIVFQYPFYAGIMGIMMATGLGNAIAMWMASLVSLKSLPFAAFVLGGVVNFSIPSAGGEWAVVGPPLVEAIRELLGPAGAAEVNRHVARVAMATAYGESLTNLLQPFFLLAVLPVMGAGVRIQARDVVGHFFVPFLILFSAIGLIVAFFPI